MQVVERGGESAYSPGHEVPYHCKLKKGMLGSGCLVAPDIRYRVFLLIEIEALVSQCHMLRRLLLQISVVSQIISLDKIRKIGDSELRRVLQSLGGWPVASSNWTAPSDGIEVLLGEIRGTYNEGILIEQWVGPDDKNSSANIIQVGLILIEIIVLDDENLENAEGLQFFHLNMAHSREVITILKI